MATTNSRGTNNRSRLWSILLVVAMLAGGTAYYFRQDIAGHVRAATAYGARTACSCRHVAGRDLESCTGEFPSGMELVLVSEDAEDRSVTAWIPLVASDRAQYREGFGCLLKPWRR